MNNANELYEIYRQNWSVIQPRLKGLEPSFPKDEVFVCPLCWYGFTKDMIGIDSGISQEHLPPEKLGGTVKTLTCKKCNNLHGGQLDAPLIQKIKDLDFFQDIQNAKRTVRIIDNGIQKVGVEITVSDSNGSWHIVPIKKDKDAAQVFFDKFMAEWRNRLTLNLDPTGKTIIQMTSQKWERNSNIALLRIAYLWGFSVFGYSFIFTQSMQVVRKQIMNLEEHLMPSFGILTADFPDEMLGISRITEPEELKSFLVVFDLLNEQTKHSRRYGVLLPQPNDNPLNVYDVYKSLDQEQTQIHFTTIGGIDINQEYLLGSIGW